MKNDLLDLSLLVQCPDCGSGYATLHVRDGCVECLRCPINGRWKFKSNGFWNKYYGVKDDQRSNKSI